MSRQISQEVCPFNVKFADEAAEPGYAARGPGERPVGVQASGVAEAGPERAAPLHPGTDAPSLIELLRMALSEEAWETFSRGSAIRRAGRAGFARNVCVALGNWLADEEMPSSEAVSVLAKALSDAEPLVREHAAWAMGRVPSERARAALTERLASERDPQVQEELGLAVAH